MFRILTTFRDGKEPLLVTTSHFNEMEEIEQRLSEPMPWTLQTEKGPVVIEGDPDFVVLQYLEGNRVLTSKTVRFPKEDQVAEEEKPMEAEYLGKAAEEPEDLPILRSTYRRFQSFREVITKQNKEASYWEELLVEKNAEYVKALREIHGELEARTNDAQSMKEKIVGK